MNWRRLESLLVFALSCGRAADTVGTIDAVVQMQAATSQVTRVTITVSPGDFTRDLARDPVDATKFSGAITVPVGARTLKADAFAGSTRVATGAVGVTVEKNRTLQVRLTLLDQTGPSPMPDHSPVVTSLVAPAAAQVDDVAVLTASAMDADSADTMSFAWSASPAGCGTFSATTALATSFTAKTIGTCTVTFTVSAAGKSDSESVDIAIAAATGDLSVVVTYVPQPLITRIAFSSGVTSIASVDRSGADATIRSPFHQGTPYTVTLSFEPAPDGTIDLSDSCPSVIVQPAFVANLGSATATWSPSLSSGACILTARLSRQTLVDSFPVVVLPAAP